MNLENRIIYDVNGLMQELEEALDRLKVFRFDSKYRMLFGDRFIKKLADWETNIRNRKEAPFTLVVCGEFKRGKSSVINALLGEDVVTTNVTTETVTINTLSYGVHSNEAVLSGGKRIKLTDDELKRDELEEIIKASSDRIIRLELKRPIELLKQITIIDTPGMGDALKDFSSDVEHALQQADAVIYLFSVSYPLSMEEQLFIKTVIKPQKYTELFLLGNYSDLLKDSNEIERMRKLVDERINNLLPNESAFMISALDERCIQLGAERPNEKTGDVLSSGFDEFRQKLDTFVQEKKEFIIPDRIQRLIVGMAEDLGKDLTAMEDGMKMSSADIAEAVDKVKQEKEERIKLQCEADRHIESLINKMQGEAVLWIEELIDKMQEEASTLGSFTIEDIKKNYSFYCIDMLQEAINKCIDYHTAKIYDELDEISSELARNLAFNSASSSYSFRFALDNKTWTKGDNVGYVVSKLDQIGLFSLVADYFAGAMRQKEMAGKLPDVINEIKRQYPALRMSVQKAISDSYTMLAGNVKKQISEYYGEQVSGIEERMQQSAMVARQDEEKKAEIRIAIDEIRAILTDIENDLMVK